MFHWDWHHSQYLPESGPTLKDAKMPDSERAALAKAINAYIGAPDPHDPEMASKAQVRQAVLNANLKMIRLNQDRKGPPEVVVQIQDYCSDDGEDEDWLGLATGERLVDGLDRGAGRPA